ncbi:MAG: hypothetical protein ABIQ15_15260 [Nocardioides sp.]
MYGVTIYQTPRRAPCSGCVPSAARFDPGHTGLDHVSFAVDSRDELERAAPALTGAGNARGEINDLPDAGMAILSFQHPDDINVELNPPLG